MKYPYECLECGQDFEIIKPVKDIDSPESCPKCSAVNCRRYISTFSFYGEKQWDCAEYNPAFGKVIRNSKHRAQEAKSRGWEEVGNESPDKIHQADEKAQDKLLDDSWRKV